jgi:hypothetical protein
MSLQKAVVTGVSGADTVIAGGMAGASTTHHDPYTTANAPGPGVDRSHSIAFRVTRALLDI